MSPAGTFIGLNSSPSSFKLSLELKTLSVSLFEHFEKEQRHKTVTFQIAGPLTAVVSVHKNILLPYSLYLRILHPQYLNIKQLDCPARNQEQDLSCYAVILPIKRNFF